MLGHGVPTDQWFAGVAVAEEIEQAMVAASGVALRIERDLRAISGDLEDLYELSAEWETLSELEQVDFSLEWDHMMADYLTELDNFYRINLLNADQEQQYRDLLHRLKDALPIIEQLNFYRPPVSLDI